MNRYKKEINRLKKSDPELYELLTREGVTSEEEWEEIMERYENKNVYERISESLPHKLKEIDKKSEKLRSKV